MHRIQLKKSPMGWNSWDCYGAAVTEEIVKQNADFMAEHLKCFGWEYIVVDIQWYAPEGKTHEYVPFAKLCMDEYGRLIPDGAKFPTANGSFKYLADYVHEKGLKFGIHIMRGIPRQAVEENCPIKGTDKTARDAADASNVCAWNPDMYGLKTDTDEAITLAKKYYESIFELYREWGVDFIKCDDIARELPRCEKELEIISRALRNCGRDMVFSISPGPALISYSEFYKQYADMWRITDDFWDSWPALYNMFERAAAWAPHTGAGHFPDADMLPIGPLRQDYDKNDRTKFTEDEQVTMMTLWSIFRAPLMIGGEMTGFDDFTMSLITNREILKMHENARNPHEVFRRTEDTEMILWTAGCYKTCGTYAALFNAGEEDVSYNLSLSELDLYEKAYVACDLWSGEKIIPKEGFLTVKVKKHGAAAFYISEADLQTDL